MQRKQIFYLAILALLVAMIPSGIAAQETGPSSAGSRGGTADSTPPIVYTSPADFSEGFDDVTLLPGMGWYFQNNSDPLGVLDGWYQGSDTVFPAQAGAPTAYTAANYNATAGVGTISDWMLTPEINLANGNTLSFWTRTATGSIWPDRLEVRLSTAGASTNVGTLATDVGDFTTLLLEINPSLAIGGYPEVWTQYTATLSGIPAAATGRIAWRYFVTNGGPAGDNSNYIGVDTVEYVEAAPSNPAISLNKTVGTTPGVCAAGDSVTVTAGAEVYYCYQIQNTGDVALNYHDLVDSELGDILDDFPYALAPGAYSPQVIVPATPMASVTNVGAWTAYSNIAGYVADDTIPYDFQDISGSGTAIPLGDDEVSLAIPMGFAFDYFGDTYTNAYVSSNGFLTVLPGQYNGCCSGQPIPTTGDPDGVIAGWWDDLYPPGGGTIVYQTLGSAPDRVFIVQFTNVPHFSSGNLVTMQFKLFEGTNTVEVHYQAAPNDGSQHSAGIENADGSAGIQYYLGLDPLATPLAVQYAPVETFSASASDTATVNVLIPNIDVDPLSLSSTQPPDTTAQQNLDVANTGAGDLMWEITEVEPADAPVGAPAAPTTFQRPIVTSPKDCGLYMGANAGPLPEGFMQYCAPAGRQPAPTIGSPRAPDDTAYSLELTAGSFFSFPLNNFGAQTGHGTQTRPIFAMDFNADATTLYAIDYDTWDFGTLDLNTAAFTVLGSSTPTGGQSWTGLTIDPVTNEAYASSCDIASSAIYSVNLSNGATTLIGTTSDAPCLIDIAIGPNGNMFGHDIVTNSIYLVNRNTGGVTLVGPTGYDANYAQGMDFDNDTGTLYIFLFDLDSFGTVYGTVDLNTGAVTPLAFAQDLEYEGAVQNTSFCSPQDAPWLSLSPTSGTTPGGASTPVVATFDSTGLAAGTYTAQLCVRSNDPDSGPGNGTNLVIVPVTLTVDESSSFYCNMADEGFSSGVPPTGWTVVNNVPGGATWGDIAACSPSGNGGNWTGGSGNAACMSPGTLEPPHAYDAELRSPMFSLAGQSSASARYLANYQSWAGNDRLNFDISVDGGATWTTLRSWNNDQGAFQNLPGVSVWVDLTPYVGQSNVMLRWHYFWNSPQAIGWYAQVDNVSLDCTELPPTAVTLNDLAAGVQTMPAPLAGLPLATLPAAAAAALGAAFVWRRKRD